VCGNIEISDPVSMSACSIGRCSVGAMGVKSI